MEDSERRPKRSRFDQTEPEPRRASRFDRRSRSPPTRRHEGRDRSPLSKEESSETKKAPGGRRRGCCRCCCQDQRPAASTKGSSAC
ncbi:hypothetical protein TrVGV298_008523 [Trichoderma virens]|nr:hypothetical protein TrVGV298_008523 [Trichoderma virens]